MACVQKSVDESVLSDGLRCLNRDGFANLSGFFEIERVKELAQEAVAVLEGELEKNVAVNLIPSRHPGQLRGYYHLAYFNTTGAVSSSILGKSATIDKFFRELFLNEKFNKICASIAGEKYRIYTFVTRQLTEKSRSLGLHQDDFGTVTLSIPLNNLGADMPTTVFLKNSHKLIVNISNALFPFSLRFFKPLLSPHVSQVGDLGIFFNKTCHGVQRGSTRSAVILIALVAEGGCKYSPWQLPEMTTYGCDFREAIGDVLHSKLSSEGGLVHVDGQSFTALDNAAGSQFDEVRTVLLHKGFDGRRILVLPTILQSKLLVAKAMVEKDFSLRNLLVNGYLILMVCVSYVYSFLSKLRKLVQSA